MERVETDHTIRVRTCFTFNNCLRILDVLRGKKKHNEKSTKKQKENVGTYLAFNTRSLWDSQRKSNFVDHLVDILYFAFQYIAQCWLRHFLALADGGDGRVTGVLGPRWRWGNSWGCGANRSCWNCIFLFGVG